MSQTLTITTGAGGESIKVLVSSAAGQLGGMIRRNGVATSGFVYLLPHEPSLTPVYTARVGADGSYTQRLPPGTYTVVAFDHKVSGDLRDPEVRVRDEQRRGDGAGDCGRAGSAGPEFTDVGEDKVRGQKRFERGCGVPASLPALRCSVGSRRVCRVRVLRR